MSTFKKAKVVMLPTNEPSKIGNLATYQKRSLAKVIKEGINPKDSTLQFWNLYIISDDEIKEGDWYYCKRLNKIFQAIKGITYNIEGNEHKIIATTNESLRTNYKENNHQPLSKYNYILPKPSDSFISKYIEEYNKGNVISDVEVEYDKATYNKWLENGASPVFDTLKVNPDNTINIKPIKDSWSREEVKQLMELAYNEGYSTNGDVIDIDKWIEENL